jgi:hypothetical protein
MAYGLSWRRLFTVSASLLITTGCDHEPASVETSFNDAVLASTVLADGTVQTLLLPASDEHQIEMTWAKGSSVVEWVAADGATLTAKTSARSLGERNYSAHAAWAATQGHLHAIDPDEYQQLAGMPLELPYAVQCIGSSGTDSGCTCFIIICDNGYVDVQCYGSCGDYPSK